MGIVVDLAWRVLSRNFFQPSFVDILPALLIGFYLGKKPKSTKPDQDKKSK
ncbi:MAG TPA: hypothetical protein VLV31_05030 [Candidatus Acidoferrales bacterium]|nr:hypothetical protein [Candidatus Acidoferrales bacterium]